MSLLFTRNSVIVLLTTLCVLLSVAMVGGAVGAESGGVERTDPTSGVVTTVEGTDDQGNGTQTEASVEFEKTANNGIRGDVITFSVEFEGTTDSVVRVEDSLSEYRANLSVQPNDNGVATIRWNTFHAGTGNESKAFTAATGNVSVIDETDVVTESVPRIVQDDYDMTSYLVDGDSTEFEEGFDEDRIDEVDVATLFLSAPSQRVIDTTPWVAPAGSFDPETATPATIYDAATQDDDIAEGDLLVSQFAVQGVFGYLNEQGTFDPYDQGLSLEIEAEDGDKQWDIDDEGLTITSHPENDILFLVVDTAVVNGDPDTPEFDPGTAYEIRMAIDGQANDYFIEGGFEETTTSITAQERTLEIGGAFEDDLLLIPTDEAATLLAETTIAPGAEIEFELDPTGSVPITESAVVREGRSVETTVDLSAYEPGTNGTLTVRDIGGDTESQVQGTFVDPDAATDVVVVDSAVSPSAPDTGEGIVVEATVRNRGTVTANETLQAAVDGDQIGEQPVEIGARETTTVQFAGTAPNVVEDRNITITFDVQNRTEVVTIPVSVDIVQSADDPFDRIWQGQSVTVTDLEANQSVLLYEVDGESRSLVAEYTTDGDGRIGLRTETVDAGDYELETNEGDLIREVPISAQSISEFSTDEDSIRADESTPLNVESNRSEYTLAVSEANGALNATELATLFDSDVIAGVDDDAGSVSLQVPGTGESFELDPSAIDPGEYTFEATVADTPTDATTDLAVTPAGVEAIDFSVAPYGAIDADTAGEAIPDLTTTRSTVASEDTFVVEFDGEYFELEDDTPLQPAFNLTVTRERRYRPPMEVTLDDNGVALHRNENTGSVYASVNLSTVNNDSGSGDLRPGYEYDLTFEANESASGISVDGPDTMETSVPVSSMAIEVTGTFRDDVLYLSDSESPQVSASTTAAPGTEVTILAENDDGTLDQSTVTVDADGNARTQLDLSELSPGVDFEVEATLTSPYVVRDRVPAVTVPGDTVVDRDELSGQMIYCCRPIGVDGFAAEETVELRGSDGRLVRDLEADERGIITFHPRQLDVGTYVLVDDDGEEYGPVELDTASIDRFEIDQSTVDRGETVELSIEADREEYRLELTDVGTDTPPQSIATAFDEAIYSELLSAVFLEINGTEQTVTIDTEALRPGTYQLVGAMTDADTAASTSFEVRGDDEFAPTAVAPKGSVDPADDPAAVRANMTERGAVALGDVVAVDLPADTETDANVSVESADGDETWSLEDDGVNLHAGSAAPVVTIDTDTIERAPSTPSFEPDTEYRITVADGDDPITAIVTTEEPTIRLVDPAADGVYQYQTEESSITAATNVAPGSEIFLRARGRSPPFLLDDTTTVDENGLASTEFDFSFRSVGTRFFVTASATATDARMTVDAIFVEERTGLGPGEGGPVDRREDVSVAGYGPKESVVLWRVDEDERVEPVTRLVAGEDGVVEIVPGLLDAGENYVLVDATGAESGVLEAYGVEAEYAGDDGRIDTEGLREAVDDWQTGELGTTKLRQVIEGWTSSEPVR